MMTDIQIIAKLSEIARYYNVEDWDLHDLQNDLEELFSELEQRWYK